MYDDENAYISKRQERSINYAVAIGPGNYRSERLERSTVFRKTFAQYSIQSKKFFSKGQYRWDDKNFGGVPVDYDSAKSVLYVDNSDAHTMVIGSTGSKKSRLIVMPTVELLGVAGESMIICDPKAEIYNHTAFSLQQKGYQIGILNFRNPETGDCWNVLRIPYQKFLEGEIDKACEYINDAAISLMPAYSRDPYWDFSSRDLFVGLTLLLFYFCKDRQLPLDYVNIQSVLDFRMSLFQKMDTEDIMKNNLWQEIEKYKLVKTKLIGTVECPQRTMACILSTFDQHLSCFSLQPQIIDLLSSTTLEFEQAGFKKIAIFLILPDEKTTYHKLVSIFIKQIYEQLIDNAQRVCDDGRYPTRVNFVLDEFSSLPVISDFPQMITASRSRNLRFVLIVQSKHQLQQRYGDETETIFSNCGNWLFLFTRELALLQEISILAGKKNNEPLISVSALQHLDKETGECLVFSGRCYPYFSHLADIDLLTDKPYKRLKIEKRDESEMIPIGWLQQELLKKRGEREDEGKMEQELTDIQKELEKKLDEIFGENNSGDEDE